MTSAISAPPSSATWRPPTRKTTAPAASASRRRHQVAAQAMRSADAVISIPVRGRAESLNVATAAAVCLYASARAQH